MSAPLLAHPIEQLYPIAKTLNQNYELVEQCDEAIIENAPLDQKCDFIAKYGAEVLEILVSSLEHENIPVLRENRRKLGGIAYENLSLWEIGYGWWVLDDDLLKRTSRYLGNHRSDLIRKYMSEETYNKLKKGGFIEQRN